MAEYPEGIPGIDWSTPDNSNDFSEARIAEREKASRTVDILRLQPGYWGVLDEEFEVGGKGVIFEDRSDPRIGTEKSVNSMFLKKGYEINVLGEESYRSNNLPDSISILVIEHAGASKNKYIVPKELLIGKQVVLKEKPTEGMLKPEK